VGSVLNFPRDGGFVCTFIVKRCILVPSKMPDSIRVELRYSGPEVDDGTLLVEDMLDALSGFQDAFVRLAKRQDVPNPAQHLGVVTLEKGSARILLDVFEWVVKNPAPASVFTTGGIAAVGGAYIVLKDILKVVFGKKALQGQSVTNYNFVGNNIAFNDVTLNQRQFEVLRSGEIDRDLKKLTAPLKRGPRVLSFELKVNNEGVSVSYNERPFVVKPVERQYERVLPATESKSEEKDTWLQGTFRSHRKRGNSGDLA
jgi:hypothetical protein